MYPTKHILTNLYKKSKTAEKNNTMVKEGQSFFFPVMQLRHCSMSASTDTDRACMVFILSAFMIFLLECFFLVINTY